MVRLTADQGGPRQGTQQRNDQQRDDQQQKQRQGAGTPPGEEPVPLSERGGTRPLETESERYNDRTRDRELGEGTV